MKVKPDIKTFRYDVYLVVDGMRHLAKRCDRQGLAEQKSRQLLHKYKKFGYSVEIKPVEVT